MCVRSWVLRFWSVVNALPQPSCVHLKGFSPAMRDGARARVCAGSEAGGGVGMEAANAARVMGRGEPVCVRSCRMRLWSVVNALPQPSYVHLKARGLPATRDVARAGVRDSHTRSHKAHTHTHITRRERWAFRRTCVRALAPSEALYHPASHTTGMLRHLMEGWGVLALLGCGGGGTPVDAMCHIATGTTFCRPDSSGQG